VPLIRTGTSDITTKSGPLLDAVRAAHPEGRGSCSNRTLNVGRPVCEMAALSDPTAWRCRHHSHRSAALLAQVQEVHTMTSLYGFEAPAARLPVTTYGRAVFNAGPGG